MLVPQTPCQATHSDVAAGYVKPGQFSIKNVKTRGRGQLGRNCARLVAVIGRWRPADVLNRYQKGTTLLIQRFYRLLTAIAFTAAVALSQTTTSGTVTETSNTPAVGLASSETAQINVVNIASNSSSGTAASCTGTISFLNASGTVIGAATPFTVASGVISSVSLPFAKVGVTGTRTEIRGVITRTVTLNSGVPCSLEATFETYDTSTGVTHVFSRMLQYPTYRMEEETAVTDRDVN